MQIFLATVILVYYAICVHGLRVKRGLSTEEQKKLMDELKKDRAEIAKKTGIEFGELTYDPSLEEVIDSIKDCLMNEKADDPWITVLRFNSVAQKVVELIDEEGKHANLMFFNPVSYRIGCSKTLECSIEIPKNAIKFPAEIRGKTVFTYGACAASVSEASMPMAEKKKVIAAGLPPLQTYADVIGVVELSGTALSL